METFFSSETLIEIMKAWGPFGAIFAIWYFQYLSEERRRKAEVDIREREQKVATEERQREQEAASEERERDRHEHMVKWDTMITTLRGEVDRSHKALDNQLSIQAMQATLLASLNEKIEKNQWCPAVRANTKGG